MKKIVWLASYPKSGNTWVRVFLNNYVADADNPVDINSLAEETHGATRALFDRLTGLESSDLTHDEVDRHRPAMYIQWADERKTPLFVKVHDAWRCTASGAPLFPAVATWKSVYILRNPLDIVASLANHYSVTLDDAITIMADEENILATSRGRLDRQLPQYVGAWHSHVTSWVNQITTPVHLIKYEDMYYNPIQTFGQLIRAIDLPIDQTRLEKAITFSNFSQLEAQETLVGFKERRPDTPRFFRKGKVGDWVGELSSNQIRQVIYNHREIMQHFGYLDSAGQPISPYQTKN